MIFFQMPEDFIVPASAGILLPVSILVKSGISILLGFLVTDLLTQRLLYRHYFSRTGEPAGVGGWKILGLEVRGLFWIVSSSVCPILALLLLVLSVISFHPETFVLYRDDVGHGSAILFASIVAILSIGFVLAGAFMFRLLVVQPVRELREATRQIGEGNFDVRIESWRADEFGELANEFNRMAAGLREREHLREMVDQNSAENVGRVVTLTRLDKDGGRHNDQA